MQRKNQKKRNSEIESDELEAMVNRTVKRRKKDAAVLDSAPIKENPTLITRETVSEIPEDIRAKLKKFKIHESRYIQERQALFKLHYSEKDTNKLIVRKSSQKTIQAVRKSHHQLIQKGFTTEQIVKLAAHDGGSKNIVAVKASFNALKAFSFTREQIVKLAAHHGGSKNIDAVNASFNELTALDFTPEQIVQLAAHDGGSKNIDAVKASFNELKALGFTANQIVQLAAHGGGSMNINAVKTSFNELKALGFTAKQIVQLAAHDGGSKNIDAVKASFNELTALDFTPEQIVQLAAHHGGSLTLKNIIAFYQGEPTRILPRLLQLNWHRELDRQSDYWQSRTPSEKSQENPVSKPDDCAVVLDTMNNFKYLKNCLKKYHKSLSLEGRIRGDKNGLVLRIETSAWQALWPNAPLPNTSQEIECVFRDAARYTQDREEKMAFLKCNSSLQARYNANVLRSLNQQIQSSAKDTPELEEAFVVKVEREMVIVEPLSALREGLLSIYSDLDVSFLTQVPVIDQVVISNNEIAQNVSELDDDFFASLINEWIAMNMNIVPSSSIPAGSSTEDQYLFEPVIPQTAPVNAVMDDVLMTDAPVSGTTRPIHVEGITQPGSLINKFSMFSSPSHHHDLDVNDGVRPDLLTYCIQN